MDLNYKRTRNLFGMIYIIFIILLQFPMILRRLSSSLDHSWMYALNILNHTEYRFGEDVFFTYGPLGFIVRTVNEYNNPIISGVTWVLIMAVYAYCLWYYYKKNSGNFSFDFVMRLLFSALIIAFAVPYSIDYIISYVAILSISLAWYNDEKVRFLYIVSVLTLLSVFIKFSTAIMLLSCVAVFSLFSLIYKKYSWVSLLKSFGIVPVGYVIGYYLYNPSMQGMVGYIKGALEISAGYSYAMSREGTVESIIGAILLLIVCILIWMITYARNRNDGIYMAFYLGPVFLVFKHGFVRASGHTHLFFIQILLFISIMVLFIGREGIDSKAYDIMKKPLIMYGVVTLIVIASILSVVALERDLTTLDGTIESRFDLIKRVKLAESKLEDPYTEDMYIEDQMLNIIDDGTVTTYPWDIIIDEHNDLNYVPIPTLQIYSSYTPYLDELNANFFKDRTTSPDYIIMSSKTVDKRHPYIESPLTWETIYENYRVVYVGEDLLLERLEDEEAHNIEFSIEKEIEIESDQVISLMEDGGLVAIKYNAELSLWGKVVSIVYQIPEVKLNVEYVDGKSINKRVILENMTNRTLISPLPYNEHDTAMFINNLGNYPEVKSIQLNGPGLPFYKKDMNVVVYSESEEKESYSIITEKIIKNDETQSPIFGLKRVEIEPKYSIGKINGFKGDEKKEIHLSRPENISIIGWAIEKDTMAVPQDVYVKINDYFIELERFERADVAERFGSENYNDCGLSGIIGFEYLTQEENKIEIVVILSDGDRYYKDEISRVIID